MHSIPLPTNRFQPSPTSEAARHQLVAEILHDPLLISQLEARVYELLQADLQQQRDRYHPYGRKF